MKKLLIKYTLFISLLAVSFNACKNSGNEKEGAEEEHTQAEAEHEGENNDVIEITQNQYNTIGIQLNRIENRSLKDVIKANGTLGLPPQKEAKVSTLVSGRIKEI